MKIVSQDATHLIASDKAYGQLIIGPILIIAGGAVAYLGLKGHTVAGELIGGAFLLFGIITILSRKVRTVTVDKTAGQLVFTVKSLRKKADYPLAIASIAKLQLVVSYHTTTTSTTGQPRPAGISFGTGGVGVGGVGGDTQTSQDTRLLLVLGDGTSMDLADGSHAMNAGGLFNSVPNEATGQKIAAFIGVPFEQIGAESLGQTIAHITDLAKGRNAAPSVVAPTAPAPSPTPIAPAASPTPAPAVPPAAAPAVPIAPTSATPTPPPAPAETAPDQQPSSEPTPPNPSAQPPSSPPPPSA